MPKREGFKVSARVIVEITTKLFSIVVIKIETLSSFDNYKYCGL